MAIIYDMVSGQFINDEPVFSSQPSYELDVARYDETRLQLVPVSTESSSNKFKLPADLAYQAFFTD